MISTASCTKRVDAWIEIRSLVWRERRALGLGFLLVVLNRLTTLAVPVCSKVVIDDVLGRDRADLLLPLGLTLGGAVVLEAASGYALSQVLSTSAQRVVAHLRRTIQAHVLRLPMSTYDATPSGILTARIITDAEQAQFLLGSGAITLASGTLTAALALGVLFWLNGLLTVLVGLMLGIFLVGLVRGFQRLYLAYREVSQRTAELAGRVGEVLGSIRVVRAYAAERREAHRFTRESHQLLRAAVRAHHGTSLYQGANALLAGGVGLLVLIMGGRAVLAGRMTVGDLTLYLSLVAVVHTPLSHLAATGTQYGKALAALGRLAELRALRTEDTTDLTHTPLVRRRLAVSRAKVGMTVVFRGVSYGYVPGHLVLRDVSFCAPAGTTVALVGVSGAGKSTLCQLAAGLLTPTSGQILIDGQDLAEIQRRDYRSHLGVVIQGDGLFSGSIEENIRYGRPRATQWQVRRAAQLAHCEEFVLRLPNGYATLVGERGVRLSGGQRQRVAIARAFLADPQILILDEATSHLDCESERLIQDALRTLQHARTTFVIAHRLSTVQAADEILVLDAGTIVEQGTHDALLLRNGRYQRLYQAQVRIAEARGASMEGCESAVEPAAEKLHKNNESHKTLKAG